MILSAANVDLYVFQRRLAGPGAYSLDQLFGISVPVAYSEVIALVAVVGVLAGIVSRRAAAAQPQTQAYVNAA